MNDQTAAVVHVKPEAVTVAESPRRTAADAVRNYLAGLAPSGRRSQWSRLDTAARILGAHDALAAPWDRLTAEAVQALREALSARYAPSSVNATLGGVFRVAALCDRYGLLRVPLSHVTDPNADGRRDFVRATRDDDAGAGRCLAAAEVSALYRSAATDPNAARGARNAAALALCHGGGLRRSEAVAVHVSDVSEDDAGRLSVRVTKAKGRRVRVVPLPDGAAHYVRAWLALRGNAGGPLLLGVTKAGAVVTPPAGACRHCGRRHTSVQALALALVGGTANGRSYEGLAQRARVGAFGTHDLRRTFVTALLDSGADPVTVARLAGHASVTTTQGYDRRGAEAKRAAVAAGVFVPVFGKVDSFA